MKNFIKQQITEITAWTGFALIIAALIAPRWVIIALGIFLICWNDSAASAFVAKRAPWLSRKIDEWTEDEKATTTEKPGNDNA